MPSHALVSAAPTGSTARSTARSTVLLGLLVALLGSLLTMTAAPADAGTTLGQRAVTEASRHYGKPYQYGATGPHRFDCSGFTQYVFKRLGKSIPRTSRDQYARGIKIAKANKRIGDLIFTYNSSGRIYHVGIYAGRGYMWASPKTGDHVRKQRIWTSRYKVGRVR